MKSIKGYSKLAAGSICAILISACGGGGGSSSGLAYTGSTTAAAITTTNGKEIATSAYLNGKGGMMASSVLASATEPEGHIHDGIPRITAVVQALLGSVNKIDLTAITQPSHNRAAQNYNNTTPGSCGGSSTITMTADDITGDFNGSFTFSNFCDAGTTMNGRMSMSGRYNPSTLVFGQLTTTFSSLTIRDSSGSFTTDGNISIDPSASPTKATATANMKIKDEATSKVFWVENFIITITQGVGYAELSESGKAYHPDHGYVDVTTPTPFLIAGTDKWPSSGVMIATGAGNSKVRLTVVSNTTYNYEIDADGNDIYEVQQLNQLWADL